MEWKDRIATLLEVQGAQMSDDEVLVSTLHWMQFVGHKTRPLHSQLGALIGKIFRERKLSLGAPLAQVIEGAASRGLVESGGDTPKLWVTLTEGTAFASPKTWEAHLAGGSRKGGTMPVSAKGGTSPMASKEEKSPAKKANRVPPQKLSDSEAVQATLRHMAEEEDIMKVSLLLLCPAPPDHSVNVLLAPLP
jgi:hypothetical protein